MNIRKGRVFVANLNLSYLADLNESPVPYVVKEEIVIEFECGDEKRYTPITFINNAIDYWGVKLSMRDGYSNHPKALGTKIITWVYGWGNILVVSDLKPLFKEEEANNAVSIKELRSMQSEMNKNGAVKDEKWNRAYKYKDTLTKQ